MRSIGVMLLCISVLVAPAAFGTSLGQKLAAVPILIGGALIAASWLMRPGPTETGMPESTTARPNAGSFARRWERSR